MNQSTIEVEARLIERIVERRNALLESAKTKAENILKAAEEEARKIKEEGDQQILEIIGSELRAIRDRVLGRANVEGKRLLVEVREQAISQGFDEAEKRLIHIAAGEDESIDYWNILKKLIVEACSWIGGREFLVSANERDTKLFKRRARAQEVKELLNKTLGDIDLVVEEPIECLGGAIVRNREGTKIFYNTLEGRLLRVRRRIEAEIAKVLGVS
jgi:V/A-type H+-transporting ATPase subunit E